MSWYGRKPGRRKEDGGHFRIDISVNGRISRILGVSENKSKYIRHCIEKGTQIQWVAFQEHATVVNDDYRTFKTATTFVWIPHDTKHNTIVSTYCAFKYQCIGKGFRFRLRINGDETSEMQVQGSSVWSFSQVYTDWSFADRVKVVPNQNYYTVEFQFEPEGASDRVRVQDVLMFFEVVDGLPTLGP